MLEPTFKNYLSPEIASRWGCFNCCETLCHETLQESGYPAGRGQYRMVCQQCGMFTWFDLTMDNEKVTT